ncbi:MAG: L,D-transpeptidase family protein [Verrucomicrobiota bacterium]
MRSVLQRMMGAGLVIGLSACAVSPRREVPQARQILYEWADDGGPGELAVTLDLARQRATYQRGGRSIGWSCICTGKPGHETPQGNFKISEKLDLKRSGSFGWLEDAAGNVTNGDATPATRVPAGEVYVPAPMPHWMRLTSSGVGMHGGVIPHPGFTASHGCIRLPIEFAEKLYGAAKIGTPVRIIAGDGPSWPELDGLMPSVGETPGD